MSQVNSIEQSIEKYGSLSSKNPLLAKELHKDNKLKAYEIPITYQKAKFKWKCHKCGRLIFAKVTSRHRGFNEITGCLNKKCENYKFNWLIIRNETLPIKKNGSFAENHPELLDEWDYEKNIISPDKYSRGSAKKVYWKCKNNHSWHASIGSRTNLSGGNGCGKCSGHGISKFELRIYSELSSIFKNIKYHHYVKNIEVDIFLKDYNLGIEPDGFFHIKRKIQDKKKNYKLKSLGIDIIRLRDYNLNKISKFDVILEDPSSLKVNDIKNLLKSIIKKKQLSFKDKKNVQNYLKRKTFKAEKNYNKLISNLPSPPYMLSLEHKFPNLSKEWHFKKNYPMVPSMFTPGQKYSAWWKCFNGHKNYEQSILARALQKQGCTPCGYLRRTKENNQKLLKKHGSLKLKYPLIAKFYNKKKNINKLEEVHCGAGPKYWWFCKKHNHHWQSRVDKILERKFPCKKCYYSS